MNNISYRAIGDVVLVRIEVPDEKTAGGIILPKDVKDREADASTEGIVVSLGTIAFDFLDKDATDTPKIGDTIVFKKYSGIKINAKDEFNEYRLIADRDVLGIRRHHND